MTDGDHIQFMKRAIELSRAQLGQTWPNPSVGAVIVKDSKIVGEGVTASGGRPHAETQAIAAAGDKAKDATMYVSLEPCSHHGKTGPCSQAIIDARIATVVVPCRDPNPLVSGKGIAQLKRAGIEVIENICKPEAQAINRGFFSLINSGKPLITLKIASSADNKIAFPNHNPRWITGDDARKEVHQLRSRYDAIATGIGTVLTDDPLLTCRIPGREKRSPVRIIFDHEYRLPEDSKLMQTKAEVPLWVVTGKDAPRPGVKSLLTSPKADVAEQVKLIAEQGVTRLLVETGQALATAFLQSGLVDRIYWFRAPSIIGKSGLAAFAGGYALGPEWKKTEQRATGADTVEIWECSPAS